MEIMDVDSEKAYPAIAFIVKHGGFLAPLLSAASLLAAACLWWFEGRAVIALAFVLVAPVVYLAVRSYVELVRIMADMLLPK